MIKIFEDDDSVEVILNHAVEVGIAGIAGGRVVTRRVLAQVQALAERARPREVVGAFSVHHFWGELAIVYDEALYHMQEAKDLVTKAYNEQLAEQGIFPDTYGWSE